MEFKTGGDRCWGAEMGGMVAHTQKWGAFTAEGCAILHPLSVFLAPSLNTDVDDEISDLLIQNTSDECHNCQKRYTIQ